MISWALFYLVAYLEAPFLAERVLDEEEVLEEGLAIAEAVAEDIAVEEDTVKVAEAVAIVALEVAAAEVAENYLKIVAPLAEN